jgi:predicted nucleotidyltransferase
MLETLFSSRVRAKIISKIFLSPGEKHNANALAQELGEYYSAVWKELVKLEKIGILSSQKNGNSKDYQINEKCPIVDELRSIVLKTDGMGTVLKKKLLDLNNVKEAFIFGSFASGEADERSDIDLMIIGEVNLDKLSPTISKLEKKINRPINYIIYSDEEWKTKENAQDTFWQHLNESPKIYIIGNENVV